MDAWNLLQIIMVLMQTVLVSGIEDEEKYMPGVLGDISGEDVRVDVENGRILGKRREEVENIGGVTDTVDWFLGIPYAQPPTGSLRFKRPVPAESWSETLNAVRFGSVCPQALFFPYTQPIFQSEDCLTLNVFVPYEPTFSNQTYPVMIYLHGGSYAVGGSSAYSANLLATGGVIVVTINYRLGMLGFLSMSQDPMPGNYGLWDQVEALRWVQSNVHHFRGRPDDVTIFGNSAGASSVGIFLTSPVTKDLFHKAIMQSGSPTAFWSSHNTTVDLEWHVRIIAERYNCKGTRQKIVDCLRQLPWKHLAVAPFEIPHISPSETNFKPTVDGRLVLASPKSLLSRARHPGVSVMTGTVQDEWTRNLGWFLKGLDVIHPHLETNFRHGFNFSTLITAIKFVITQRLGWSSHISDVITDRYVDWTNTQDPQYNIKQFSNMMSDYAILSPCHDVAEWLSQDPHPRSSVYVYLFNHTSPGTAPPRVGAYHQVELKYIFGCPFNGLSKEFPGVQNYSEVDENVSRTMVQLWTNFAKYGNPTPNDSLWQPYDTDSRAYLDIRSDNLMMMQQQRTAHMHFWNKLIPILRQNADEYSTPESYLIQLCVVSVACCLLILMFFVCFVILCWVHKHYTCQRRLVAI